MSATDGEVTGVVPATVESAEGKLVYVYLDRAGWATPDRIATALSLPKLSVLGVLGTLADRGLVERSGGRYRVA
jgi:DNA-binding IclR family transcriptional regulator